MGAAALPVMRRVTCRCRRPHCLAEGWGEGYAAFTYSRDQIPVVKQYIINQKEHHRKTSFAEEYRQFIIENGGEIDETYFLKD